MTKAIALGAVLLAASSFCCIAAQAETFAERLGWGPEDRVLIIHADDVGMCHETNLAAAEAWEFGTVSSMSIMMPCPWVGEIADYLKTHPEVDAGLHLTLNSEWKHYRWGPVAGRSLVPGLTDEWGCLWNDTEPLVQHASPDEVEMEIRAQIDRAVAFGIKPTHIDTHMGSLFGTPEYAERYIKVAIEKQIPMMMVNLSREESAERAPELSGALTAVMAAAWGGGLPVLDHLIAGTNDWAAEDKKANYIETLRNLKPGLTEMIVHCAKPSDTFSAITGIAERWNTDYLCMTDPEIKRVLEEEGIILTTWRELKSRRDALGD